MSAAIITHGSKIGLHGIYPRQTIPLVHAARDRGAVWPLVKGVDNGGIALDVKAIEPRTLTITRFVNTAEDSAQDVDRWTAAEMRTHAAAALGAIADRLNAQELAAADWLEPINEADPPGVKGWGAFGLYLCELVRQADRRGVKIALPAFNSGTPEWDEMQALVATGLFGLMLAGGHILTTHEGLVRGKPVDIGFGDSIPGAPHVDGAGSICFRYRYLYSLLRARNEIVPLVISEFYGGGSYELSAVEQVARFAWYDREARKDPYVLAVLPFTIDPPATKWQDQDYTYAYPAVLDYLVQERDVANAVSSSPPEPVPTPPPPPATWPAGVCLAGLHGRADGRNEAPDFTVINRSKVEAILLLSSAAPAEAATLIATGHFVLVRLFASFKGRRVSAADFVSWSLPDVAQWYDRGVRYFQVHNEPNLIDEGLGSSWADGAGFAAWFMDVRAALKAKFPQAQFGFPGLSPGGGIVGVRADAAAFLQAAAVATAAADWIGVHCYWQSAAEMASPDGGAGYLDFRRRFPSKLLFITEFANIGAATSPAERAGQYVAYYKTLRHVPNLGAAFAWVVSASDPTFWPVAWRSEQGALTAIPDLVGANMVGIQQTPAPIQEDDMNDAQKAVIRETAAAVRQAASKQDADLRAAAARLESLLPWWENKTPTYKLAPSGKTVALYNADGTRRTAAPIERALPGAGALASTFWDVWERKGDLLRVTDFKSAAKPDWWVRGGDVAPL